MVVCLNVNIRNPTQMISIFNKRKLRNWGKLYIVGHATIARQSKPVFTLEINLQCVVKTGCRICVEVCLARVRELLINYYHGSEITGSQEVCY